VLEALADEVMPARVDLTHLEPADELRHLLAGGMTFRLWPENSTSPRLAFRTAANIRRHPGRGLPNHDCDVVRQPDPTLLTTRQHRTWTEEPPY
jgi:hypothetical protein